MDIEKRLNQAVALHQAGKLPKAEQLYQQVLADNPRNSDALHLLGVIAYQVGKHEISVNLITNAIEIDSQQVEAYNNLGIVFKEQGKLEESVQAYHKAIEIQPCSAEAYNNLGNAYQEQGELELAIQAYHKAIEIQDDFAEAHNNLGQILLLLGYFRQGWEEYEWRWQCRNFSIGQRNFPQPLWNGSNLQGKSILVWAEQGIGDEIMFANLLDSLKKISSHIIVECEIRLVAFFQRSFPETQFVPRENPPNSRLLNPNIDYQVPIGSLGQWLRPDEDSFNQNRQSYLTTSTDKSEQIKKR